VKKLLLMFCGLVWCVVAVAQDMHYTQFFNSPLTLNPALTGLTRGNYRVGIAHRSQWFGAAQSGFFNAPFSTPSVFFDAPITINDDAVGIGGIFISDQTGGNAFSSFTGCLSASYIKSLGKRKAHQLSAGIQIGYTHKSIRQAGLRFESQFVGTNFFETLSNEEQIAASAIGVINLNGGVLWFGKINRRLSMYAGGSVFNVSQSRNQFLMNAPARWYLRWNVHTGIDITLGDRTHLLPCAMYMRNETADQLLPGASIAFDITPAATVSLGSLTRVINLTNKNIAADATALYGAFDYQGFKLGVSYDFTVSELKRSKSGLGAFEVTMIYIGRTKKSKRIIFCPMF